jgi:hypothetical protein
VRFNIFLCFFLRIRLRRFLMSDPMAGRTLAELRAAPPIGGRAERAAGPDAGAPGCPGTDRGGSPGHLLL